MLTDTVTPNNWAPTMARRLLLNYTAWPAIERQADFLGKMVRLSPLHDYRLHPLMALADLPDSLKDRLLEEGRRLSLAERARLGDRSAADSLLQRLESATSYDSFEKASEQIGFVGSKRLLRHLIRHYNRPLYKERGWLLCSSARYPVLKVLQRHHPHLALLNTELRRLARSQDGVDSAKVVAYNRRFEEWARATYGVVPEKKEQRIEIIKRPCSDCPFHNYKYFTEEQLLRLDSLSRVYEARGMAPYEMCP
jgi:hypothetical protein